MKSLSRRTILQGLGTSIALPLLDSMAPAFAGAARTAAKTYPNRMLFLYVPNGVVMPEWRPKTTGAGFELPSILEPLKNVRDALSVFSGLTADKARPNGDGPGDHARALSAILTGCQARKTNGADINVGISADQYAAQLIGKRTRFPSLEIGIERGAQAGNCDSGYSCAYSSNLAWSSATTPVAKEIDPRALFDRLFGNANASEMDESAEKRDRYRKSILDFVREDATRLKAQLGANDQRKLDEYLSGIRQIEQRLAGRVADNREIKAGAAPDGVPPTFDEHVKLMADMLVLALQADLTRIGTFLLANEGSNRPYREIGVPDGHHDLSHHGRNAEKLAKIQQINRLHTTLLAYLAEKLQASKEGDGTLLDHAMIAYVSGISDGDRHNHNDLPCLLLGRGGGTVKTAGRHLIFPDNTPVNNLWLAMLDRMGCGTERLGDSTGRVALT